MSEYAANIIDANFEDELGVSFGRYARATILARALPDVRDGLKPVQRRILYSMFINGNGPNARYRKSAKTVGDVMGTFHPHGDQSIYDALVRQAQYWKMRELLVDGHGNFGSIDDDPPAAMRYTEARLAPISLELLRDIHKDTVIFQPNFDDNEREPTVLPSRYPNLLVNGSSGVSTGFSTEIPPHNLGEVINAVIAVINDPEIELNKLMKVVKGPDFPTGGVMIGKDGLRAAYETGKGRVVLRGKTDVETRRDGRKTIVITEIPYGVIKSNLVRSIERMRAAKAVQGITDIRDETDREGLRIVVELGRGVDAEPVLAYLFKKTDLQIYQQIQMVAIDQQMPKLMNLREILDAYIDHQKDVLIRRSTFDVNRAEKRLHIVEGLIKAVDILDDVIATIRAAHDRAEAHQRLIEKFQFTEEQSKEILDLRLHRLTGLQILQLREEEKTLAEEIKALRRILKSKSVLMETIQAELLEVRSTYKSSRRTKILAAAEPVSTKIDVTVTVKEQPVVVGVSHDGYIKRSVMASFEKTGGDAAGAGVKEGDSLRWMLHTNTLHRIVLFTARGQCYTIPVHQIPEARWGDVGTALVNVVAIEKNDRVVQVFSLSVFDDTAMIAFVTRLGMIKRSALKDFDTTRSMGVLAYKLTEGDEVVTALQCTLPSSAAENAEEGNAADEGHFIVTSREGMCIRFDAAQVSQQGRTAGGVRAIKLFPKDYVVDALWIPSDLDGEIGIVTEEGRAKRSGASEYPLQNRGGRGIRTVRKRGRMPHRIAALLCWEKTLINRTQVRVIISDATDDIVPVAAMPSAARDGNGYEFARVKQGQQVLSAHLLEPIPEYIQEQEPDIADESFGDAPVPKEEETQSPTHGTPTPDDDDDEKGRGNWARQPGPENSKGVFYLPGMDPEGESDSED